MVTQEVFVRENKTYTLNMGTNEQGMGVIFIDVQDRDLELDQPIRYVPVKMESIFDENGVCQPIVTSWRRQVLSNNGKIIKADPNADHMTTNTLDMQIFTAGLGSHIMRSIANGWVRCIQGFNTQPIFSIDGSRIPDINYDTTLPPTNNYHPLPIVEEPITEEPINEEPINETPDEPTV